MANFNFGHVGAIIEAGKAAAAHIDISPMDSLQISSNDNAFYNNTSSFIRNSVLNASPKGFIWMQKWGNSKTRVVK